MQKCIPTLISIFILLVACTSQTSSAPVIRYSQATITPSKSPIITVIPIYTPSLGDYFPQLIDNQNVYLDLPLIEGELVLDNGCLRLAGVKNMGAGDSFLIIWDPRFSTRTEQGVVQVVDSVTSEVLASVGDYVAMGNNGGDLFHPIREPIPKECHKPYLIIGELIKKIDRP